MSPEYPLGETRKQNSGVDLASNLAGGEVGEGPDLTFSARARN